MRTSGPGSGLRGLGRRPLVVIVALVVLLLVGWAVRGHDTTGAGRTSSSGLPAVSVSDLPREAVATLALIEDGGPFPYARDGAVFQNRERLLPDHPRGWYREYTVPTPGEDDRGARRVVTGDDGTAYWTDDHYDSFRVIEEDP